ncbi:MAG: protein O-mannosyl-transferase family, partial [Anaerolineae bacterium]
MKIKEWAANHLSLIINLPLLLIPILFIATLAQTPVLGDPTEYTFVANILGIAHPPGYAFITVVGKLFQTLVPFGSIPWRMHLLSAVMGTAGTLFVFGTVLAINNQQETDNNQRISRLLPAIFAALVVGTAVDYWQHSIHANPHVITAVFLAANLFFLTKWYVRMGSRGAAEQGRQSLSSPFPTPQPPAPTKWLYAFCVSAGLGVTHHPLTVFAWPGYALFILVVWFRHPPHATRSPLSTLVRTLPKMLTFACLG